MQLGTLSRVTLIELKYPECCASKEISRGCRISSKVKESHNYSNGGLSTSRLKECCKIRLVFTRKLKILEALRAFSA